MEKQYGVLKEKSKLEIDKILDFAGALSFSVEDAVEILDIISQKHNITNFVSFDFINAYENNGNRWDEKELVSDLNYWEEDLIDDVTIETLYSVIENHKNLHVLKSGLIVGYGY